MTLRNTTTFAFAVWFAYNFGAAFGYKYPGVKWNDPFSAAFYGCPTAFMAAWIVGLLVVWPILAVLGNALFGELANLQLMGRRKAKATPPFTAEQLEAQLAAGMVFAYDGLVNRTYHYQDRGVVKVRVRLRFTAQRNTLAMSRREVEAIRIFETLRALDLLGGAADRIRFALAWNDSRCLFECSKFSADSRLWRENGWKSDYDIVAAEAAKRGAHAEGAINELFSLLQTAAIQPDASPRVLALMKRYTTADQSQTARVAAWS